MHLTTITHQLHFFHYYNGDAKRLCSIVKYYHCLCAYFENLVVCPRDDNSRVVYPNDKI